MPKFGGPGRKKKRCIHRQCLNQKQLEKTTSVNVQETIERLQSITGEFHYYAFITHADLYLMVSFFFHKAALHQNRGPARLITSNSSVELAHMVKFILIYILPYELV